MIQPSDNLARAYLHKTKNAIKSMEVNAQAGITDWTISASYYARYFAVYALLMKVGVKSEIHDCTIALFSYLFGDDAPQHLTRQLRQSKKDRIENQYYTQTSSVNLEETVKQTRAFTLEIDKIIDELTTETISQHRKRLTKLRP